MDKEVLNYEVKSRSIIIEGIEYSFDIFKQLGGILPLDTPFIITDRKDGVLMLCRGEYTKHEESK